jgi:hypothetical protein
MEIIDFEEIQLEEKITQTMKRLGLDYYQAVQYIKRQNGTEKSLLFILDRQKEAGNSYTNQKKERKND